MSRLRVARGPLGLVGWILAGFSATLLLIVVGALLSGDRAVVVLSGSMEPVFSPGDVLIERSVEPRQVEIGQVVTFHEPGSDRMLTHRVRKIEARGSKLVFTTKGDADNGLQRWAIDPGGQAGPAGRADPGRRPRGDAGEDAARPGRDRPAAAAVVGRSGDPQDLASARGRDRRPGLRSPPCELLASAAPACRSQWP